MGYLQEAGGKLVQNAGAMVWCMLGCGVVHVGLNSM